jgi:hypothetical protein
MQSVPHSKHSQSPSAIKTNCTVVFKGNNPCLFYYTSKKQTLNGLLWSKYIAVSRRKRLFDTAIKQHVKLWLGNLGTGLQHPSITPTKCTLFIYYIQLLYCTVLYCVKGCLIIWECMEWITSKYWNTISRKNCYVQKWIFGQELLHGPQTAKSSKWSNQRKNGGNTIFERRENALKWYGHVARTQDNRWP